MTTETLATLRVAGTATSGASPDQVEIRLAAEHEADSAAQALEGASEAAEAMVRAVRAAGVSDHDLQTAGMSLDRSWDPNAQKERGYVARHRYVVRAPIGDAGALISATAEAGGDSFRVESVGLTLRDTEPLVGRAQRDAFDNARNQATELARLAGRQLGPVLAVDTAPMAGPSPVQPKVWMEQSMPRGVAASMPGIEGGEFTVTATVVVVYQLM